LGEKSGRSAEQGPATFARTSVCGVCVTVIVIL
jgi:hypothetical protein